jgi:hypothetical protein
MTFRFTSAANREIRAALLYYEDQTERLGNQFLDEVEAAIARVLAMPHAWSPFRSGRADAYYTNFHMGSFIEFRESRYCSFRWRLCVETRTRGNICFEARLDFWGLAGIA